jgi:hypothetical protein
VSYAARHFTIYFNSTEGDRRADLAQVGLNARSKRPPFCFASLFLVFEYVLTSPPTKQQQQQQA